jgi:hypothetical protein
MGLADVTAESAAVEALAHQLPSWGIMTFRALLGVLSGNSRHRCPDRVSLHQQERSWTPLIKVVVAALAMTIGACSKPSEACTSAGGTCGVGPGVGCPNIGPQNCNDTNVNDPGGHYCCLPCPKGTKPSDGGTVAMCVDAGSTGSK